MQLHFMSSLENTFILSELESDRPSLSSEEISQKLITLKRDNWIFYRVLMQSSETGLQVKAILYNQDGSLASFSGNGFACLASLMRSFHQCTLVEVLSSSKRYLFETSSDGNTRLKISHYELIDHRQRHYIPEPMLNLIQEGVIAHYFVDLGNEHLVIFFHRDWILNKDREQLFLSLAQFTLDKSYFADGINLGLAYLDVNEDIILCVHERGCGFTQACSSGALACAIATHQLLKEKNSFLIQQKGGRCRVDFDPELDGYILELSPHKDQDTKSV